MNKGIQKKTSERFGYVAAWDFDYEVIGTAIGWMVIVFSIGQPSFFVFFNSYSKTSICVVVTVIFGRC